MKPIFQKNLQFRDIWPWNRQRIVQIEIFHHFLDFASLAFLDFAHNDRWAWCLVVFLQFAGSVNIFLFFVVQGVGRIILGDNNNNPSLEKPIDSLWFKMSCFSCSVSSCVYWIFLKRWNYIAKDICSAWISRTSADFFSHRLTS